VIKFFRNLPTLLKTLNRLSKNQLLHFDNRAKLPISLRILDVICTLFFYPKGLLIKPKKNIGNRVTDFLQELGPIYIKLGQTLSTRPDLIGSDVADSLKYLQDKLPSFNSKIVKNRITERFGKDTSEIFEEFDDKPVAAASIAQVHKAHLKSGEIVAVKALRPNITKEYERDISFFEYIAQVIESTLPKTKRLKLKEVIELFRQTMKFELDLRQEAAAASRIRDNFLNDHTLHIPKIYWELTSSDIITLEWIDGVSIYNKEDIIKLGYHPKEIASKISVIFFNQAYRDGFFHADLHPGNILLCKNGKVALLDFGIIGIVPEDDRLAIAEILYAFLKRDYELVAKVHKRIGYIPKDTNLEYFAQSCRAIAEPIVGRPIKDISIGTLLAQLFKVTEEYGMETQTKLLMLQKTMIVVEGIGQTLDKDINMWQLAEPWIKKWAAKNLSPEAKVLRFVKKFFKTQIL